MSQNREPFYKLRVGQGPQFCGSVAKNRQQQVQGEIQGLTAAEIVFLLTLHGGAA
jgi:hypothetical protein